MIVGTWIGLKTRGKFRIRQISRPRKLNTTFISHHKSGAVAMFAANLKDTLDKKAAFPPGVQTRSHL